MNKSYLVSVLADDGDGKPDGHAADCLREEVWEEEEDDVVGKRPKKHFQEGHGLQDLHDDHRAVDLKRRRYSHSCRITVLTGYLNNLPFP